MAAAGSDASVSGTDASVPETDEERIAAVTALESEFGELITHFRRTVMANATRLSPGMLPGAYKTFTTIVRYGTCTASTLAEVLQMDKGQLSRTIRELEDLGLIQRTPDAADRRSIVISPTDEGLARLAAARRPQEGAVLRALSPWPVEDIHSLTELLRRLTSAARDA